MISDYLNNGPITPEAISHLMEKLSEKTNSGAHSIFLGQVRADEIKGKKVRAIEYSAYKEMVKAEADKIIETILLEFNDTKSIEIVHSTGTVKVGEISLLVLVSAGHRHHAMQACSKTVEMIKKNLPVWKKEIFDDDSHQWKQNISI
jgi:molybdopterin synthase catalytic subunit